MVYLIDTRGCCLSLNENEPTTMHIDLNSCYAMIEQQEKPLLRGKCVVVVPFISQNAPIISPSVEAKAMGVKTCMTVAEAKALCPEIIVIMADPPKYLHVHKQFKKIFNEFTPDVDGLSIDEAVLQLKGTPALKELGVKGIAQLIKAKMKSQIGCWITCSIGVGTNRFLAKTAAGLKKPDGFNVISHINLVEVLSQLKLMDLCGIAEKNQARLNAAGIFCTWDFLQAPIEVLEKQVFQSIEGYYWHMRLRGYEVDDAPTTRGTFGNSYSLKYPTMDKREVSNLSLKLCEKASRRMRKEGYAAQGVHVSCVYNRKDYWHQGKKTKCEIFTTQEMHVKAQFLLNMQPWIGKVTNLSVSLFGMIAHGANQLTLFDDDFSKRRRVAAAVDSLNDRYGEYSVYLAPMHGLTDQIVERISFGNQNAMIEEVYNN